MAHLSLFNNTNWSVTAEPQAPSIDMSYLLGSGIVQADLTEPLGTKLASAVVFF